MIAKLLGHAQVQTTVRYAHLDRNSIQTAAARITGRIDENLLVEQAQRADRPGLSYSGPIIVRQAAKLSE